MTRRQARENAFYVMFAFSYGADIDDVVAASRTEEAEHPVDEFGEGVLALYTANAAGVDHEIETRLKGWTVGRLPRVSLAILRLAVAEMLYSETDVDSIVINEAVELSKRFGGDEDYQFVNGLLGTVSRDHHGATKAADTPNTPAPPEEGG